MKDDFLRELNRQLRENFSQTEIEEATQYYDELICDKIESGMSEQDAVLSLGSIKTIVSKISAEIVENRYSVSSSKQSFKNTGRNFTIILLLCLSPALLPLGIALFVTVFSLFVAAAALVISFSVAVLACLVCAVPVTMMAFQDAGIAGLLVSAGALLFASGILGFLALASYKTSVWLINSIIKLFAKLISRLFRKEVNHV